MTMFDMTSLHDQINQALDAEAIPAGHTNAIVLAATTGGGVKAIVATKIGNVWEIDAMLNAKRGAKLDAGVQVKATW